MQKSIIAAAAAELADALEQHLGSVLPQRMMFTGAVVIGAALDQLQKLLAESELPLDGGITVQASIEGIAFAASDVNEALRNAGTLGITTRVPIPHGHGLPASSFTFSQHQSGDFLLIRRASPS